MKTNKKIFKIINNKFNNIKKKFKITKRKIKYI